MILSRPIRRVWFDSFRLSFVFLPLVFFISMFEFALPIKLESLENSLSVIGFFISLSWIATTFLDFFFGSFIDRIGKKKGIFLGVFIFMISAFLFGFYDNIWILFLLNTIAYVGYDFFYIAIEGYLISLSPKKLFNYASSGFYCLWSFSIVFGPLIAAYLMTYYGQGMVYSLSLLFCLLPLIVLVIFVKKDKIVREREIGFLDMIKKFKVIIKKSVWFLLGIMMCTFWHSTMIIGIPLLFLIEENSIWQSAIILTAFAAPFVFTDLITGFIANNSKRRAFLICIGLLLGAASLFVFYFSHNIIVLAIAVASSTIGMNIAWAIFDIEAGLVSSRGEEASVEGAFVFAKNMGWDTSPLFFGLVAQFFGIRIPFLVVSIAIFILAAVFFFKREEIR